MKKFNCKFGKIVQWVDYIKTKKDKKTGNIMYSQSNVEIDGYNQRYIGLYISHTNLIYIAVAVNKKSGTGNWWRYIIENRIQATIASDNNIMPDDKGVTVVPIAYKDFLYKDPYAYNNLYGIIDPTQLDLAIKMLQMEQAREIDVQQDRNLSRAAGTS